MDYYSLINAVSIILSLICGWLIFEKYRNLSGFFFLLFTFFASGWFFLYFLFFSGISDIPLLLTISRFDFGVGIGATYSLFFFLFFFDSKPGKIFSWKLFGILGIYLVIFSIHAFTDRIVAGLDYVPVDHVYREIQGSWYLLNAFLHVTGMVLIIFAAGAQINKQVYLNRIRLKRVLFSAFLFMTVCLFLQLVLPTFYIWILEREIVLFFALFVLYAFFTIRRYYFSSLGYGLGKVAAVFSSIVVSIILLNVIKFVYLEIEQGTINNYWINRDHYSIIDATIAILIFRILYGYIRKVFLGVSYKAELKDKMQGLQRKLSYTTNVEDLNDYLRQELKRLFKTNLTEIHVFNPHENREIQRYFENDLTDKIFINDVVFLEERKARFNREKLFKEIPKEAFLILPLFNAVSLNTGVLIVGAKPFGDFYTIEEIDALRNLASFLELHLKYISIYEQIRDLSVNLDKKVDEKTMEYNQLISQQKEFISVISHEIKSPLAAAIFQADSILDDLENDMPVRAIKAELELLTAQLIKTGELTSKLFSIQQFETHRVTLYKEKIQIRHLLQTEYEVYSRMHGNIRFINHIREGIGFFEIDRIQFQQVIANLLNNAVKFCNKEDATIMIGAEKRDGFLHISIEDNGEGFQEIEVSRLFERYSTGGGGSAGLGMGLYLCKKIIDLHGGEITATISDVLGGAKFSITIPAI